MPRDWKLEARRLLTEDCQDVHGPVEQTRKACCPRHLSLALREVYETGRADERAEREAARGN